MPSFADTTHFTPRTLRALCAGMLRADFEQACPHPWLVYGLIREPTTGLSYRTRRGSSSSGVPVLGALSLRTEDVTLFRVHKRGSNDWEDRVSVGRAGNNDVVLRHASVSKLHAYFTRDATGAWALTDARSTNGTFVNLRRVLPGSATPLRDHALLRFGSFRGTLFLHPSEVYDALTRQGAR